MVCLRRAAVAFAPALSSRHALKLGGLRKKKEKGYPTEKKLAHSVKNQESIQAQPDALQNRINDRRCSREGDQCQRAATGG